ncbi:septum formation initiator family protein [Sanguibacter sp. 25GB23B1]|uniref:FtsB family cell division protein n=1 Tax=unclassified Sanguibacter TaxID=2645534 RepID=UPI0032B01F3C
MPPASRPPAPRPSNGAGSSRSTPRSGRGAAKPGGTPKPGSAAKAGGGAKSGGAAKPASSGKAASSGGAPAASGGGARRPSRPAAPRAGASRPSVLRSGAPGPRKRTGAEPTGWLRVFTVRSAVFVLVALMAFVLVTPTAVQFLKQREDLQALRAEVDDTRSQNADLTNELDRWADDKYVIAQARERLTFVFPGETPYRVIDPESVVETTDPETGQVVQDGAVTDGLDAEQPWYTTVWETVQVAGDAP